MNGVSSTTHHRISSPLPRANVPASTRRVCFRVDARVFAPAAFALLVALLAFVVVTFSGGTAQAATANGWEGCPTGPGQRSCSKQYSSSTYGLVQFTYSYIDTWDLTTKSGSVVVTVTVDKGTAGVAYQCKGSPTITIVNPNGGATVDIAVLHTNCASNEIGAVHVVTAAADGSLALDGFLLNTTPEASPSPGAPSPSPSPAPTPDPVPDDRDCSLTFNVFKILKCAFIPSAQDSAKYAGRMNNIKTKPPLSVAIDSLTFFKNVIDVGAGCGGDCPADNAAYNTDPGFFSASSGVNGKMTHDGPNIAFNPIAQAGDWVQGNGPAGKTYDGPLHFLGSMMYKIMQCLIFAGVGWYWFERVTGSLGGRG